MPEALIRKFLGVATDLPESRNSGYAHDVLNVYSSQPGSLSRREGVRRAIEEKFNGPIRLILPVLQPGGEYTGAGLDLIVQDGEYFYGTSAPRSPVVATSPTFVAGVEQEAPADVDVDYSPHVTKVIYWFSGTQGRNRLIVRGRNFDNTPSGNILQADMYRTWPTGRTLRTGIQLVNRIWYTSPDRFVIEAVQDVVRGDYVMIHVTNPNGESDIWDGWVT